eukprot:1558245-Pleurochrysis_carterae.AAC.1
MPNERLQVHFAQEGVEHVERVDEDHAQNCSEESKGEVMCDEALLVSQDVLALAVEHVSHGLQ